MCSAGRAAVEEEVKGRQLDTPRARGPGEGEPSGHHVSGCPDHAMAPQTVGEERQGEAVGGAWVGSTVDAEDGQVTAHGRGGKEGKELRKRTRGKIAGKEMGSLGAEHLGRIRGEGRQGGAKAGVVRKQKARIAVVGNGMPQEGVRGEGGPRIEFVLGQTQHRGCDVRGADRRDVRDAGGSEACGPTLRESGRGRDGV